jgi:hypothetical protein
MMVNFKAVWYRYFLVILVYFSHFGILVVPKNMFSGDIHATLNEDQGSILRNFFSAENFSNEVSATNFGESFT